MLEVQRAYAARLAGRQVRVGCTGGNTIEGILVSVNRTSVWVVNDDTDHFVHLADVIGLAPAA